MIKTKLGNDQLTIIILENLSEVSLIFECGIMYKHNIA